jgi:sugar phosphate isomerase/epimerase
VPYVQQAIRFASELGCPCVDTTDGAKKTQGYTDDEVFRITVENYRQCLSWAEDYGVTINVETHGPYTTDADFLRRLFRAFDSEHLRFNFDTGNTFIAGLDPLAYLKEFRPYLKHCHVKDVSAELAAALRGDDTGIATSNVPVGGGVNAENITKCVGYLRATEWSGVLSIECFGSDENIARSVKFLRDLVPG